MKRLLLLVCCLLALPLIAQEKRVSVYESYKMPTEVYESLLAKKSLDYPMVVYVGSPNCVPCKKLLSELKSNRNGTSMLEKWKEQGVRFYTISLESSIYSGFSQHIGTNTVPVLLFYKNGKELARLNGFNASNAARVMAEIQKMTERIL